MMAQKLRLEVLADKARQEGILFYLGEERDNCAANYSDAIEASLLSQYHVSIAKAERRLAEALTREARAVIKLLKAEQADAKAAANLDVVADRYREAEAKFVEEKEIHQERRKRESHPPLALSVMSAS